MMTLYRCNVFLYTILPSTKVKVPTISPDYDAEDAYQAADEMIREHCCLSRFRRFWQLSFLSERIKE
jgi:hypothetical protein